SRSSPCPLWVRSGHHPSFCLCPLYPRKRTNSGHLGMSALCQKRTYAVQQTEALFDQLVGAGEQRRRHAETGWEGVAEQNVMESLPDLRPRLYPCGLMLAARITLAHFSVSSAMSLPKSAGEPASTVPPRLARRAFILGSSSAALTSLLSLSTISVDVFFGAPTPNHVLAS